jgi:Rne/Rng family ribonuclease
MNKELYVSSTPHETKVALTEDDQLAEVFFERENEYTLAGSIYKGRVTRVLPGMQSAFVDIGLERDAFLYVSDFLELTGEDDEDGEFGEIPAPRGAIELGKPQLREPQSAEAQTAASVSADESDADLEPMFDEEAPAPMEGRAEPAASEDQEGDGARPWRGRRRRRGGRRGRGNEGNESAPETQTAPPEQPVERPEPRPAARPEPRHESRPRHDYAPPAGYAPIILPGESISKYRNMPQPAAETRAEVESAVEDFIPAEHAETAAGYAEGIAEEAIHLDQGFDTAESSTSGEHQHAETTATAEIGAAPVVESEVAAAKEEEKPRRGRWWRSRRKAAAEQEEAAPAVQQAETPVVAENHRAHEETAGREGLAELTQPDEDTGPFSIADLRIEPLALETEQTASATQAEAEEVEEESHTAPAEHEVDTPAGSFDLVEREQHAAPSVAPEGRTLEHEVLEEEEAEFQPMPNDLTAMREVAGDEELVLEEETLDANGFSDRWVPKIEDVDEDEIVAAEERGEKLYSAEDEEEEAEGEEEEVAERAELRAAPPTAGYQQRTPQRPGYERRGGRFDRDRGRRGGSRRNNVRPRGNRNQPLITDLLKEGQEVLIQIAKEPIGKKGARITSHIALPGRFLVYMPTVNHVGVSRKINSDEERQRLKRIVTSERENGLGGFIVRTAAANIKEDDLRADIRFLKHLWHEIKDRAENSKSPALIYHDLNLVERVLRDQVNADFSQIWVDTEDEYERVVRFANRFQPSLVRRIKLYTKDTPLYEQFGIQDEINRSLKSKVWLKSGGHIVINQTEALVAIDVNTGKFVGKTQRLEDTIVKVNVDAIKEIVRQIRLRDLGGIIVIDFIDMDERKNRQKVMMALEEALRWDRAPSKVLQFNDFGLVAITRKRVKQSLERTLGESCPYCTGAGFVKSVPTVANELYIEMRKMAKVHDKDDITLRVNPEVAKYLKANNGKLIGEMEELTGKTVLVKSDPALHQENFDIH